MLLLHAPLLQDQFHPPPWKEFYANTEFVYSKPLFVISNKYNVEWGSKPLNFMDYPTLRKIFSMLTPHFTVLPPGGPRS